jgi:hypothetical protein
MAARTVFTLVTEGWMDVDLPLAFRFSSWTASNASAMVHPMCPCCCPGMLQLRPWLQLWPWVIIVIASTTHNCLHRSAQHLNVFTTASEVPARLPGKYV